MEESCLSRKRTDMWGASTRLSSLVTDIWVCTLLDLQTCKLVDEVVWLIGRLDLLVAPRSVLRVATRTRLAVRVVFSLDLGGLVLVILARLDS